MKTILLLMLSFVCLFFLTIACHKKSNSKLIGNWKSNDGTSLQITTRQFILADTEAPVAEDYFIKGDTIFTSFEGNQPYTKFVIKKLDDRKLDLLFPDSVTIAFTR